MAIVRKEHLTVHLEQIDLYYKNLRETLLGATPSPNLSHTYNCEADQFSREFTDIDLTKLNYAVAHFKAAVDGLKAVKSLAKGKR